MAMTAPSRVELRTAPTPLVEIPALAATTGVARLLVKRDDLTGFALGGNKVRKLEYLLADAASAGADTILVMGGPGSNLCQTAAVAARVLGFDCELVLYGDRPDTPPVTLAMAEAAAATSHFTGDPDRTSVEALARRRVAALRDEGRSVYVIPRGGATPVGSLGYHRAAHELVPQMAELDVDTATVIVAVGSGGTLAGLVAGFASTAADLDLIGASVSRSPAETEERVWTLAVACAELAGGRAPRSRPVIVDARGSGYGRPSSAALAAGDMALRVAGLVLDPVYTAKAFATLIELAPHHAGRSVIFWHTGGTAAALDNYRREVKV